MMTRLFLAAGVAALAIAAPASADRGERGGGKGDRGGQAAQAQRGGGGGEQRMQRAERRAPQMQMQRAERQSMPRMERREQRAERQSMPRMERRAQRLERQAMPRAERRQERASAQRAERAQRFAAVRQERAQRASSERRIERQQARVNRVDRRELRAQRVDNRVDRRELRAQRVDNRIDRRELRGQRIDNRMDRRELRAERINDRVFARNTDARVVALQNWDDGRWGRGQGQGLINGCPPGLWARDNGCLPPGQAKKMLGQPLSVASRVASLAALPQAVQYLYPDTDDHYYRYANGYLYQVDRDRDLISTVLPLIAGGFMQGQYLPQTYMSSYVPNQYGFNSFYPSSYSGGQDYGYGYDNLCNRYANGVVYQVDCGSGYIEDVIPLYAGGYGVGQVLPASYGYYNVPLQYRDMYYNTPDQNYWYSPGAIYQVDPTTQLITAIASLLAPGLTVGQQLPTGYGAYNVPLSYRDTYYDTDAAWYRYNNGNIYQVDPTTQLVTALVASVLT